MSGTAPPAGRRKPNLFMMPWFPRDFLAATRGWSLISRAIYRELLDCQWEQGSLPAETRALRELISATPREWNVGWPAVSAKFERCADGSLRNSRLEEHRQRAIEIALKRSEVGRRGGLVSASARQAIAQANAEASAQAEVNHQDNTSLEDAYQGKDSYREELMEALAEAGVGS